MRNLVRNSLARLVFLLLLSVGPGGVLAQDARVMIGGAAVPGIGAVVTRSAPTLFVLTQEATAYVDVTPTGDSRVLVAVGVGGAVQLIRIMELAQNRDLGALDIDLGMRLGPSFYYDLEGVSAEEEARSFRIMFDPFIRGSYQLRSGRILFGEIGAQAPGARVGVSLAL